MGYNVARNPIWTMPNTPLASDPGKELHPPVLSTLAIHGGQVKIDIYIYINSKVKKGVVKAQGTMVELTTTMYTS